ncbi:hypothetical protein HN51_067463 [Arachis hypogaea]
MKSGGFQSSKLLYIGRHLHSHGGCLAYYEALCTIEAAWRFLFLGIHQLASVKSLAFEKRNFLSFGEAFNTFLPPMVHISMNFLSFALNLVLLFPVYPAVQCLFKMPLIVFYLRGPLAVGISLMIGIPRNKSERGCHNRGYECLNNSSSCVMFMNFWNWTM